jgi:hypothetical protein
VITSICALPVTVTPSSFSMIVLVEVVALDKLSAVSPAASVADEICPKVGDGRHQAAI